MTKTKKADDQEAGKLDWIASGWTDSLGIKDLWVDLKHKLDTIGYEDDKRRGFDADTNPSNGGEFYVKHPDGRRIRIAREQDKIVIEADERKKYDKKAQAKLRRSFVETKPDLLAKEIIRQVELLLAAYTPLWNEREDVQAKLAEERKVRRKRLIELSKILISKKGKGDPAVKLPGDKASHDDDDDWDEDGRDSAIARFAIDGPQHRLTMGSVEVKQDGTHIEIDGPLTPDLAATIVEVIAGHLATKVKCRHKDCRKSNGPYYAHGLGLVDADERASGLCDMHLSIKSGRTARGED